MLYATLLLNRIIFIEIKIALILQKKRLFCSESLSIPLKNIHINLFAGRNVSKSKVLTKYQLNKLFFELIYEYTCKIVLRSHMR